jgi:hypothetical protein
MRSADAPPPARQDRRKERTRAALVGAAQRLISEGIDAGAGIQAITDLADVGFGSFHNYFSSKEELFDAATSAAVDDYLNWLDERVTEGADPVTRLIDKVRDTGRLPVRSLRHEAARPLHRLERAGHRGTLLAAHRRAAEYPTPPHPFLRKQSTMSTFSPNVLRSIAENDDLFVSPYREDRTTYGTPTQTWALVVGDKVYVRAANGQDSRWYRAAITQKAGRIRVAGQFYDVTFAESGTADEAAIDAAYEAKYPGSSAVPIMQGAGPKSAAVVIAPR